jgi:hypothetical protein
VEPTAAFAQLQLGFVDQTQWRYELIRPLVLFADRTARQRAQETHTHPDTVRTLQRRFRQQGMQGLLPADVGLNPTSALSGAISAAKPVQMKANSSFSFMIEHRCLVQRQSLMAPGASGMPGDERYGQRTLSFLRS